MRLDGEIAKTTVRNGTLGYSYCRNQWIQASYVLQRLALSAGGKPEESQTHKPPVGTALADLSTPAMFDPTTQFYT